MTTDVDSADREWLRRHCLAGQGIKSTYYKPSICIESSPDRAGRARCRLSSCGLPVETDYRAAVFPGAQSTTDFYHIYCLEKIADLAHSDYLDLITPIGRNNFILRGLSGMQILDGSYLLDGGLLLLISEWRRQRGRWIDKRDGVSAQAPAANAASTQAAGTDAASAQAPTADATSAQAPAVDEAQRESILRMYRMAPIEDSFGPRVKPWNLYHEYLDPDDDDTTWHDVHDLSSLIATWCADVASVNAGTTVTIEDGTEASVVGNKNAVAGIKRLSGILMGLIPLSDPY